MKTAAPGYWKYEASGVLRPVIEAYLAGQELDRSQLQIMRSYLRQWMAADWEGSMVGVLRRQIENIETMGGLRRWLARAGSYGIDPL